VEEFLRRLQGEAPPLARITSVQTRELSPTGERGFQIVESEAGRRPTALIPPDVALCADCAREIGDPNDRRSGYPFTNCTNCGPRFTIVRGIPYDRPQTTMAAFEMCEDCAREYGDPRDRRFHAEPVACPRCGPEVVLEKGQETRSCPTRCAGDGGRQAAFAPAAAPEAPAERGSSPLEAAGRPSASLRINSDPALFRQGGPSAARADLRQRAAAAERPAGVGTPALQVAAGMLGEGKVVAIKGLGGYHVACDARNPEAVETLRRRKGRGQKPFAIMVRDLAEARRVAEVSERAAALLTSPESPVVILPAKEGSGLAEGIAPRQRTVGVMLPYTPLHRLLLDASPPALVMTSGNLAEEPIVHTDEEARAKLGPIADHTLSHNREIAVACDDSVVRVEGDLVIPVRRARGYVPRSVPLDYEGPTVLAVGGQHKHTFCLLRNGEAILSQHIGDLDTAEVLEYFGRAVRHFEDLFEVRPEIVAHDLHPGYLSTQWARSLERVRLVGVQHHHAHVVSVMAELGLTGPVIGVAYDGTGYGPDGTVWGGEILIADRRDYRRAFHLRPVPLPGGEAAIRRPGRMALSHLMDAFGGEGIEKARKLLPDLAEAELRVVARQIERGVNSPGCSSMGRFFDAVGALLGATPEATYEGQPAMELEAMAHGAGDALLPYDYEVGGGAIDVRPVVRGIVEDLERGADAAAIAARFHETIARFTVAACARLHEERGPRDVVLCGGVMQNARLLARLLELLSEAGLRPHIHREIPPNDGGMSLGQAVIAAAREDGGM